MDESVGYVRWHSLNALGNTGASMVDTMGCNSERRS